MILSHSSIDCASTSVRTAKPLQKTTHRLEELNLSVRQVTQHLLHLGLFPVLENNLFPQRFLAEGMGRLMSSRNRIL